ncbi:MAG: SDR family NAD(P)-dependent oxidoreductase [Oscillospiraceae bacterium]|nr:SDR family NAD(P)-dependent oxidoreductase [Oscillospiraceae bacterium]
MEQKPTVSILGDCVSRDLFAMQRPDDYIIEQYVSFASPMSLVSEPPQNGFVLDLDKLSLKKESAFSRRCLKLDCDKAAFSYLAQKKSEWLVMDLADARFSIAKFYKSGATFSISNDFNLHKMELEEMLQEKSIKKLCTEFSEEEWEQAIQRFLGEVLKLYQPEQIIFHEHYNVLDYISKDGKITPFLPKNISMRKVQNALLKKLNTIAKERLKGCHLLQMPDYVMANAKHKWGLHPLHYVNLYYEYAARAVDVITAKKPLAQERAELSLLKELYTQKFTTLRQSYQLKAEKPLFGKTAIVTGGSGEIGSACCLRLAQDGAKVAVCGRNKEKLQAVVDTIRSAGGRAEVYAFDVTDVQAIHENFKSIYDTFGSIDILVNNAGASERNRSKYLYNQSPEVIDEMLMLNLRAAMLCTRKAFQFMVKKTAVRNMERLSILLQ